MSAEHPRATELCEPFTPTPLPRFDAVTDGAIMAKELYDALERMHREAKRGYISPETMASAQDVLTRASSGVK